MEEFLDARRVEAVTAAQLEASRWPAQAFRSAVFSSVEVLRWWVTERKALAAVWARGHRRELTAAWTDEQLDLADRRTGEGDPSAPADGATPPPSEAEPPRGGRWAPGGRPRFPFRYRSATLAA